MHIIDARPDQLKLVKLERRILRPLAEVLLSDAPTAAKRAAVAGAALALASLAGAPEAYAAKLGLETDRVAASAAALADASGVCDQLAAMVEASSAPAQINNALGRLFSIVDEAHRGFNALAADAGARLFRVEDAPDIGDGGGNKDGLFQWLTRSMTLER